MSERDERNGAEGTGLGLPICQMLMQMMPDGQVRLFDIDISDIPTQRGPVPTQSKEDYSFAPIEDLRYGNKDTHVTVFAFEWDSQLTDPKTPREHHDDYDGNTDHELSQSHDMTISEASPEVHSTVPALHAVSAPSANSTVSSEGTPMLEAVQIFSAPDDDVVTLDHQRNVAIIVDDDRSSRRVLLRMLRRCGVQNCIAVHDGEEALAAVQGEPNAGIVFMDLHMARQSGTQACSTLREHGITIPIIACTGSNDSATVEMCRKLDFDAILSKPFSLSELRHVLLSMKVL